MNLSTPQCSSGSSQSRRHSARPVKIMESAGHTEQQRRGDTLPSQNGGLKVQVWPKLSDSRRDGINLRPASHGPETPVAWMGEDGSLPGRQFALFRLDGQSARCQILIRSGAVCANPDWPPDFESAEHHCRLNESRNQARQESMIL